jgi:hypothetical protein
MEARRYSHRRDRALPRFGSRSLVRLGRREVAFLPMAQADPPKIDIHDIATRLWETADERRAKGRQRAAWGALPSGPLR